MGIILEFAEKSLSTLLTLFQWYLCLNNDFSYILKLGQTMALSYSRNKSMNAVAVICKLSLQLLHMLKFRRSISSYYLASYDIVAVSTISSLLSSSWGCWRSMHTIAGLDTSAYVSQSVSQSVLQPLKVPL